MSRIMSRHTKSADRLKTLNPAGSVFAEYTALANRHQAVNLGQGFPTLPVAEFIRNTALRAVSTTGLLHQYARSEGHSKLVQSLSRYYSPLVGQTIDPTAQIVTTVGATEAIYSTIQAFVNPGDEVIIMQPYYDSYAACIAMAGGIPVVVSLKNEPSGWKLDYDELRKAVTPKTKALIINNPHNPVGKVFTRDELDQIAQIATEYDLLVIADEVYETLVYSDSVSPMIKFASLPGMFDRTVTIGSAGKAFGITGWKIGWIIASAEISRSIWLVHQFVPFSVATPLQEAVADCFDEASKSGYFEANSRQYETLRDKLLKTLQRTGFRTMNPDGGYFIVADVSDIQRNHKVEGDFCKFLTTQAGVTPIPMNAFYQPSSAHSASHLVRFAFCKDETTIEEAERRLTTYFLNTVSR